MSDSQGAYGASASLDMTKDHQKKGAGYEWVVLSVTTVGTLLVAIQETALLISLPSMMSELHMDFLTVMWVLLTFLLITTVMVPIFGHLSDMFGRKRLYVLGYVLFISGSLLCALAQPQFDGWDLVGYRVVQALGGALIFANAGALIADAFGKERLGVGLGVNMVASGAGLVLGPVVGGILSPLGWQWIFLINIPFGLFGVIWATMRLKEPARIAKVQSFDWAGSATFSVGLFCLLFAISLIAFPLVGPAAVYALLIVGLIGLSAFFFIERKSKHPMMDFKLFRNREYAVGNITGLLNGLCRGAALFLLIFFFQGVYGDSPLIAGLSLIPFGITMMVVGPLSGKLSDKYGPRLWTILGLALTAASLLGLAFIDHTTSYWVIAVLMLMMGAGNGLFMSPNGSSIMKTVPPDRRGGATGTRMMLSNTGQMFSLALAFTLVLGGLSQVDLVQLFLYGGSIGSQALIVFENGLHSAFLIFFVVALITVIVAMFRPGRQRVGENCEVNGDTDRSKGPSRQEVDHPYRLDYELSIGNIENSCSGSMPPSARYDIRDQLMPDEGFI